MTEAQDQIKDTANKRAFYTPPITNTKFNGTEALKESYNANTDKFDVESISRKINDYSGRTKEQLEKEIGIISELPLELTKLIDTFIDDLKQPKYVKPLTVNQLSALFQGFYLKFDKESFQYLNGTMISTPAMSYSSSFLNAKETLSSGLTGIFSRSRSSSMTSTAAIAAARRHRRSSSTFSNDSNNSNNGYQPLLSPAEIHQHLEINEIINYKIDRYMELCEHKVFKRILEVGTSVPKHIQNEIDDNNKFLHIPKTKINGEESNPIILTPIKKKYINGERAPSPISKRHTGDIRANSPILKKHIDDDHNNIKKHTNTNGDDKHEKNHLSINEKNHNNHSHNKSYEIKTPSPHRNRHSDNHITPIEKKHNEDGELIEKGNVSSHKKNTSGGIVINDDIKLTPNHNSNKKKRSGSVSSKKRIFNVTNLFRNSVDYLEFDQMLDRKIKTLQELIKMKVIDIRKFLGIPYDKMRIDEDKLKKAEVESIFCELTQFSISPFEKSQILLKLHEIIMYSETMSNDEYLSLLIYYLIIVGPKHIFLNVEFIKLFRYKKKLIESELYAVTNLVAGLVYIEGLTYKDFPDDVILIKDELNERQMKVLKDSISSKIQLSGNNHNGIINSPDNSQQVDVSGQSILSIRGFLGRIRSQTPPSSNSIMNNLSDNNSSRVSINNDDDDKRYLKYKFEELTIGDMNDIFEIYKRIYNNDEN